VYGMKEHRFLEGYQFSPARPSVTKECENDTRKEGVRMVTALCSSELHINIQSVPRSKQSPFLLQTSSS
jgi:hypothetical protein